MKFVSAAIVAVFLCVAVVSAAPSTPNPTFEELAFSPFNKIADKLQEYLKTVQCSLSVAREIVSSDEDLKNEFVEIHSFIDNLISVEWVKCQNAESSSFDVLKCKAGILKQVGEAFPKFIKKVSATNKDLAKKISEQVADQCLSTPELFGFSVKAIVDSLPAQYQCITDVLAEVSIANGMAEKWSRSQPQMQYHLDNWKACAGVGNKYLNILCNLKEAYAVNRIFIDYMKILANENQQALIGFALGVQKKCGNQNGSQKTEELLEVLLKAEDVNQPETVRLGKFSKKLKCAMNAADEATKSSKYQTIFEQHKMDMYEALQNFELCRLNDSMVAAATCMFKEMATGVVAVNRFASDLMRIIKTDGEFAGRMSSYVIKCFA